VGSTARPRFVLGENTVHPHVRGVHGRDRQPVPAFDRFIPTCVGSTYPRSSRRTGCPVHPHVRGLHPSPAGTMTPAHGSSPRAWAPQCIIKGTHFVRRFIPTCVGSTKSRSPA